MFYVIKKTRSFIMSWNIVQVQDTCDLPVHCLHFTSTFTWCMLVYAMMRLHVSENTNDGLILQRPFIVRGIKCYKVSPLHALYYNQWCKVTLFISSPGGFTTFYSTTNEDLMRPPLIIYAASGFVLLGWIILSIVNW